MEEKLLLFTPIFQWSAEAFVRELNQVDPAEDVEIWINSPGGSVFAGWSIIGALSERTGKNNAKIFGDASSMTAYMLLFLDNVEALDVATFTIHRADGYATTDEEKAFLAKVNKDLRSKMEKKIKAETFKEVSGYSFDEVFDPEKRINVNLDAKQAKKIGLIDKVVRLEPAQIAAFSDNFIGFHSFGSAEASDNSQGSEEKPIETNKIKTKNMTKEELKAQFPETYAAIVAKERERIEAIMAYIDIDLEACKKMISDGSEPGHKFYAEMNRKALAKQELTKIEEESDGEITKDPEAESKEPEVEVTTEKSEFVTKMREAAGLKEEEV